MSKFFGKTRPHKKIANALADLHLSLDHGVARLRAIDDRTDALDALLKLHVAQREKFDEMVDVFEALSDVGMSWSEWLNRPIDTAAIAENTKSDPEAALLASERRIIAALDACIAVNQTDPVRGILEDMRFDTQKAAEAAQLKL